MSDQIKHECGIALLRLKKPLQYYIDKYGSPLFPMNKLYLLMEKQHNRGQDGAGIGTVKLQSTPGVKYISRIRSVAKHPIEDLFERVQKNYRKAYTKDKDKYLNAEWIKKKVDHSGEVLLGHLRYGTHGKNTLSVTHPRVRESNWKSRNLVMAGNFNLTNVDELFHFMMGIGQHPREMTDTVTVMEKIGHFLDQANDEIIQEYKDQLNPQELGLFIEDNLDLNQVLRKATRDFDGGFVMAGLTGYGAGFVARDPNGIRPGYYYSDDEFLVVASEKPAIKTAFNIDFEAIQEIPRGNALIFDKSGNHKVEAFTDEKEKKSCSFERIYFSRGTDPDIYRERKKLGQLLVPQVMEEIDYDLENTVFSYIPNTAETAFLGMIEELEKELNRQKVKQLAAGKLSEEEREKVLSKRVRVEKLVIKDAKLRTFITNDDKRDDMVAHVYDTTYEVINKGVDTLVVMDDSIVRGTTLEKSILQILDRLNPKKIVIVSSAPQIRYPDCYGIDMSRMQEFVAFRALLKLIEENNKEDLLDRIKVKCEKSLGGETGESLNHVKELYDEFSNQEISDTIARIISTDDISAEVKVIYQTLEGLHSASPEHTGDWYFSGNYPTSGGNRVVNKSYLNFMKGSLERAY